MKSSVMMPHIVKFLSNFYSDDFSEIESYSLENKIPAAHKCVAEFLRFMVNLKKPKKILEIGAGVGFSTAYLSSTGAKVTAIDYNKERVEKAKQFLKDFDNVEFVFDDAKRFLKECNEKFDFVFVDSVKRDYLEMFYLLEPHLENGSFVIFDDVLMYGLMADEAAEVPEKYKKSTELLSEFLKEMYDRFNNNVYLLPIGNGVLLLNYEC
ncbi:methyltransferase domain-containing protein [Deferribacter autotrophicus]|uniref:Methyltransferase domain-containing protein n=1 Tax=Deferribacter autotrophicus TaxID=500465 RepID=A0A5A8F5V2_9BACT|nr:class I SAM-dependent methyltransferase [Deferribacter autotrophicus]KAA0257038.1 methyltransferase domain-containing protein [Deferribacter autotrophicus]